MIRRHHRKRSTVKVQIQYFEGCPNWRVAERRLREALDLVGDSSPVERCPVETQEEAERLPTGSEAYGLTCRVYPTPEGLGGSPSLRQCIDAAVAATSS
jgi:hypothetical protein